MTANFRTLGSILLLLLGIAGVAAPLRADAQAATTGKGLNDPFLDKLIGEWQVDRRFPNGRSATNLVHAEWVLQHQFVQLHYRDAAKPGQYEALVLIGYDGIAKRYLCHWADVFGADYSTDGFAPRNEGANANAMEFKFTFHDGDLINRFTFDPQAGSWTSKITQNEKGQWKIFCEDKFARVSGEPGSEIK